MFRIAKRFEFAASHQLTGLPLDHPCSRLHGHNYTVEVILAGGGLDQVGMVYDYRALQPVKAFIDTELDHQHLNQVLQAGRTTGAGFDLNPTAEWLAWWLYWVCHDELQIPHLAAVRVAETPGTWAEYTPPPPAPAMPGTTAVGNADRKTLRLVNENLNRRAA